MKIHYALKMWLIMMVLFSLVSGESKIILKLVGAAVPSTWIALGVWGFVEDRKKKKEKEEQRIREFIATGKWTSGYQPEKKPGIDWFAFGEALEEEMDRSKKRVTYDGKTYKETRSVGGTMYAEDEYGQEVRLERGYSDSRYYDEEGNEYNRR